MPAMTQSDVMVIGSMLIVCIVFNVTIMDHLLDYIFNKDDDDPPIQFA